VHLDHRHLKTDGSEQPNALAECQLPVSSQFLTRKRAEQIGTVEAPDEQSASPVGGARPMRHSPASKC